MKPGLTRPLSYQIGPYIVRRDATGNVWRVFTGSVCIHSGSLLDMWKYAEEKTAGRR